jgi:CheY-like chemotaxis protein
MRIVRKKKGSPNAHKKLPPWKILIVDDEADIHAMTRLALNDFKFVGKKLHIIQAMSGAEAREILKKDTEISVAFIDVVMETDDAGLQLVNFIRNKLKYRLIRLIVRTGQPGIAPEKEVIERYDIDDYKDKTELTSEKLYTTMRLALKSYRDLKTLDTNRQALRQILDAAPKLYQPQSLNQFFNGVLSQIIGLCNLGENSLISTIDNGLVVTTENQMIQAGTGRLTEISNNPEVKKIITSCSDRVLELTSNEMLPSGALLIPLKTQNNTIGFIYLENAQYLDEADKELIEIMVNQCTFALDNLQSHLIIKADSKHPKKPTLI